MPVATKTLHCPTCGAKCPKGASRCRVCTRTLVRNLSSSQARFTERMYAMPVRGGAGRQPINIAPYALFGILALLVVNYFSIGYGPKWVHQDMGIERGADWRSYQGLGTGVVVLPGSPIADGTDTSIGYLRRARVGVNQHWSAVLDSDTHSAYAKDQGQAALWATIVVGETAASADLTAAMTPMVNALVSEVTLSDIQTHTVSSNPAALDVTATFQGPANLGTHGHLKGRLIQAGGHLYIFATYYTGSVDDGLQDKLASGLISTSDNITSTTVPDPAVSAAGR